MTAFFTSDHHFGHKRIIELAKRPFTSVDEMDEYMIVRWNDRVKPGDTIYHVGDFAFTDHDPYLRRLNGQKFLVPGNHDHSNRVKKATGWVKVDKMMDITLPDGMMVVLCHYAMRVWSRSHHGAIHLSATATATCRATLRAATSASTAGISRQFRSRRSGSGWHVRRAGPSRTITNREQRHDRV